MSDGAPRYGGYEPPHQPSWGQPPAAPPDHPLASTAMVLGIIGVAGGLLCWLPLLVAPVAWFQGHRALKEIDGSKGTLSGRSEAKAGVVLGAIGTALLVLALLAVALFVAILVWAGEVFSDGAQTYDTTLYQPFLALAATA